jgi:hypothetical protein
MTIHIPITSLEKHIRKLYLENKITQMSIDYAPNHITGWNGDDKVVVFDFSPLMRLDNRKSNYNIYTNPTEIIVEIIPYRVVEFYIPTFE